MTAKVGVILSGAGYLDGAELHEAVLTLYFLDRAGAQTVCFAPDVEQMHVVNHLTGEPTGEKRNVLLEAARVARGDIKELSHASMQDLDALVLPGGFGAAKNLSDFAIKGADCEVDDNLVRLLGEAVEAKKPIAAICIAPAVVAAALKRLGKSATLTIGNDAGTAAAIQAFGSEHKACAVQEMVADDAMRIVSTPAYMLGPGPKEVGAGIEAAISQLMRWLA